MTRQREAETEGEEEDKRELCQLHHKSKQYLLKIVEIDGVIWLYLVGKGNP